MQDEIIIIIGLRKDNHQNLLDYCNIKVLYSEKIRFSSLQIAWEIPPYALNGVLALELYMNYWGFQELRLVW